MAILKTYKGQPVKHMRRTGDRIQLILFTPVPGQPGTKLLVTQAEWTQFGRVEQVQDGRNSTRRKIAAAAQGELLQ